MGPSPRGLAGDPRGGVGSEAGPELRPKMIARRAASASASCGRQREASSPSARARPGPFGASTIGASGDPACEVSCSSVLSPRISGAPRAPDVRRSRKRISSSTAKPCASVLGRVPKRPARLVPTCCSSLVAPRALPTPRASARSWHRQCQRCMGVQRRPHNAAGLCKLSASANHRPTPNSERPFSNEASSAPHLGHNSVKSASPPPNRLANTRAGSATHCPHLSLGVVV